MEEIINNTQPVQQTPNEEQPPHEESLEELSAKREFQIKQKKILFNKIKAVFILLTVVGIGLIISYVIYERQRTTAPAKPVVIETPEEKQPSENVAIWELHRDDNLKVFIKIPPDAKVFTHTNPSKVEVVYARNEEDFSKITESNLTDGYIFRVTPLSLGVRDLNKIVQIKQESFRQLCPSTATISKAQESLVDTIDASYFTVSNCNVEYVVSYIPRFGIFYEVAQIYRGDIGVGQQYRAKTQELLNNFRFFPEDSPKPYDPNITYYNDANNFSLKYPDNMDTSCCTLDGPAKANNQSETSDTGKLLTAAYLPTYQDASNFDGFALYLVKFPASKMTFDTYLAEQRQRYFEDYKIVKGTEPVVSEEEVQVGPLTGKYFKGYQWQGTDVVYLDLTNTSSKSKTQVYLAIIIKNLSGDEFKQVMDKILSSFEYFPNLNR